MGRVRVELPSPSGHAYDIEVDVSNLDTVGARVRGLDPRPSTVLLLVDERIRADHAPTVERSLERAGLQATTISVPTGESAKRRATAAALQDAAIEAGADRRSVILGLGGGVTGDLAGFVAATLYRGVRWVGVPTTLLAMVDSSVGGKTGVDTAAGKNLVGAFWQPAGVVADVATLATLPDADLRSGLAEVIKYGVIVDSQLFVDLEDGLLESCLARVPEALIHVVERSVTLKAQVVAADEREGNRRQILNFGHTIGHAVEAAGNYALRHGEAVAIGMVVESRLAEHRFGAVDGLATRIADLCRRAELPTAPPCGSFATLLGHMRRDKKAGQGQIRCALALDLGEMASAEGRWSVPVEAADLEALLGAG